jgi:hypothetical protein
MPNQIGNMPRYSFLTWYDSYHTYIEDLYEMCRLDLEPDLEPDLDLKKFAIFIYNHSSKSINV